MSDPSKASARKGDLESQLDKLLDGDNRKYADQLDAAVLAALSDGQWRSRAEVTALFHAEPREAIGRSLQRLNRDGRVESQGFRASTRYRAGAKTS